MVENVGRKLLLIAALLAAAVIAFLVGRIPLGLDLAGGTRLVYRLPIEDARRSGAIGAEETDEAVLQQTIEITRNRVDPQGVLNATIRKAGADRIEIAVPATADVRSAGAAVPLGEPLAGEGPDLTAPLQLAAEAEAVARFPGGGGVVQVGSERIRYGARVERSLVDLTRGLEGTPIEAHPAGELVELISDDSIKNRIENLGDLRFFPVASASDFQTRGTDLNTEQQKVRDWLAANSETPIAVFNALPPEQGGPPEGILWYPHRIEEGAGEVPLAERDLVPVVAPPPEWTFTGADLARVGKGTDPQGFPSVTFEMTAAARVAFGDFTEAHVDEQMAIVLNDVVVSAPNINEALRGSSHITGRFNDRQVNEMVTVLRSGSLKIKPILEHEEKVGATLGADYVRRGLVGGLVALAVTLLFLIAYYRRLGVFACVALLSNLVLLMGAMALLQASLTLPGIAGIVLTVGMAVDANILIFDRLREEAEKGRKTIQAAKDGFANALSAIIDGNVTTLLTALILYKVGTGPIRGFAVTLSIGILTSMFAALVITRVLVHLQLERGIERFSMTRWLADANYKFITKGKAALALSSLVVVGGVALFIGLPDQKKLGIDFLGGARVTVRTEEAVPVERARQLVAQVPGEVGRTAEVVALPASEEADGLYREFAITYKTDPGQSEEEAAGETLERDLRTALAEILQRGPVEVALAEEGGAGRAELTLYFQEAHPPEDVAAALAGAGMGEPQVEQRGASRGVFVATGTVPPGTGEALLRSRVQAEFAQRSDPGGRAYRFATPIAEATVVGKQVVGELRDSAIQALLLSILLVVIYIRVRFAEYSYGIAAVAAVVHDILITLGAVAVLVAIPWIRVEMNLTLIAAFLTILGYSLNDTIVIFDRVRENLPRMKASFAEIVNVSINQTLSRTIVTSGTTLVTITIVLLFNLGTGNDLEGFAFALIVGLLSGTYSTIFIACPILVWLEERGRAKAQLIQAERSRPVRAAEGTAR